MLSSDLAIPGTSARKKRLRYPANKKMWPHLAMALIGASWAIAFDVGIKLYLAEALAVAFLPIVAWRRVLAYYPSARSIVFAYSLWVIAIIVADTVNSTPYFNTLRNVGTPILAALSLLVCLVFVSDRPTSFLTFLAAMAMSKAIFGDPANGEKFRDLEFGFAAILQDFNYVKVRIAPFLTPLIALLACLLYRSSVLAAALVILAASVFYFAVDARSEGLTLFCGLLLFVGAVSGFRFRASKIGLFAVVFSILSYIAYITYVNYTFQYNPAGHNGLQLATMENPYNPVELLFIGRPEWLVIGEAIYERPVFGWGSWALDIDNRFSNLKIDRLNAPWGDRLDSADTWRYIPVHSMIGTGWVWGGMLGLAALLLLFRAILKLFVKLPKSKDLLMPALCIFSAQLLWHFFFSPPQFARLMFPAILAALIVTTHSEKLKPAFYFVSSGLPLKRGRHRYR